MTAYEVRISDWSSDVCSSDLRSIRPISIRLPSSVAVSCGGRNFIICAAALVNVRVLQSAGTTGRKPGNKAGRQVHQTPKTTGFKDSRFRRKPAVLLSIEGNAPKWVIG